MAWSRVTRMTIPETNHQTAQATTAPVLRRIAAVALDYVAALLYLGVLRLAVFLVPQLMRWFDGLSTAHLASFFLVTLPISLYFAVSEASTAEATVGKRLMRIRVQSWNGTRLTLAASLVRTAIKFTPWELGHAAVWRFHFAAGNAAQERIATAFLIATWVLVAVYLACLAVDKGRRTPYDLAARSIVVRDPETATR